MPRFSVFRDPLPHEFAGEVPFAKGDIVDLDGPSADRWVRRGVLVEDVTKKASKKASKESTSAPDDAALSDR